MKEGFKPSEILARLTAQYGNATLSHEGIMIGNFQLQEIAK